MGRPRHQNKDYELLFVDAEARGWRVVKTSKHFQALCPCAGKHIVTVSATPSVPAPKKIRQQLHQCEREADRWKQ